MPAPKPESQELTIFQSGNSAALRLPKAMGFVAGERVVAYRDGEALVIRHADPLGWPVGYFDSWEASTIDLPERAPTGQRDKRLARLFVDQGGQE